MRALNLDTLERQRHTVEKNGAHYPLRQITPRIAYMLEAASQSSGVERMTGYYDAVARLLPTMPRDEVDDLEADEVLAIVHLAGTAVRAVDEAAADPNALSSAPTENSPAVTEPAQYDAVAT